jgi:hypothetical protein
MGMRRIFSILLIPAAGLAGPAFAYCPSFPDGPQSGNVANGTALALCQQAEVAADAARRSQQVQIQNTLQMLERQQFALRQRLLTAPPLTFPAP